MAMDWRYWQERQSPGPETEPGPVPTPLAKHLLGAPGAMDAHSGNLVGFWLP